MGIESMNQFEAPVNRREQLAAQYPEAMIEGFLKCKDETQETVLQAYRQQL